MPLDDPLADGQSDSRTGIPVIAAVRPVENLENRTVLVFGKTDAVVANANLPFRFLAGCRDMHLGRIVASILNGIANEVLKELRELRAIGQENGQRIVRHGRTTFDYLDVQIF